MKENSVLKETNCLACKHKLDAATSVKSGEDVQPSEGDWSCCIYCGKISRFTANGDLRPATAEELVELHDQQEDAYFMLMKVSHGVRTGVFQIPMKKL